MSVLKILRMVLLGLIVVVAIVFTVKNPNERVRIDLMLVPVRENVLLIEVLLYAMMLGVVVGVSFAALKILELQAQLRTERRSRNKVQGELTALRNLPLEEADEAEAGAGS